MKYFKKHTGFINELNKQTYLNAAEKAALVGNSGLARKLKTAAKTADTYTVRQKMLKTIKKIKASGGDGDGDGGNNKIDIDGKAKFVDFENIKTHMSNSTSDYGSDKTDLLYIIDIPIYDVKVWEEKFIRGLLFITANIKNKDLNHFYWSGNDDIVDYKTKKIEKFSYTIGDENNINDFLKNSISYSLKPEQIKTIKEIYSDQYIGLDKENLKKIDNKFKDFLTNTLDKDKLSNRIFKDFFSKNNLKHFFGISTFNKMSEHIPKNDIKTIVVIDEDTGQNNTFEVLKNITQDDIYDDYKEYLKNNSDDWITKRGEKSYYAMLEKIIRTKMYEYDGEDEENYFEFLKHDDFAIHNITDDYGFTDELLIFLFKSFGYNLEKLGGYNTYDVLETLSYSIDIGTDLHSTMIKEIIDGID